MSWEWSHTSEAYRDAEQNLRDLDRDTLRVIWAEWCAASRDEYGNYSSTDFDERAYQTYYNKSEGLTNEALIADIWDRASEYRTCDNGGFNAWMCPYGCGCHTVAFDRDHLTP